MMHLNSTNTFLPFASFLDLLKIYVQEQEIFIYYLIYSKNKSWLPFQTSEVGKDHADLSAWYGISWLTYRQGLDTVQIRFCGILRDLG